MKTGIHPEYRKVVFRDINTGDCLTIGSTKKTSETITMEDGKEYPLVNLDTSSASHPFYTGKQKYAAADGRIDRFNKKYGLNN